jgi:hypothetical protein
MLLAVTHGFKFRAVGVAAGGRGLYLQPTRVAQLRASVSGHF